ncbi:hypothetical protein TcCL_ESM08463 [Trypanosoma cruzi]|uniref:Par3/HAL N-terminal domain-containing protein n=2 Tax=Trypanosoma cruzi TaxID=5693 RepID=Q4D0D4_TRYCC|nr:hypothetical protein, conserved [Trypanosoma cruzi]EAN85983.1 hypothetical protein, conserved [Trypanosoma cruzi]RNC54147.1 hypothetical protein TcCL_ESM08463 [Trypanosoma cruzi]|eukprot:XP_807834.1 hypothetical protein [Trypanosoma cruzi strain CL Brener]
MHLGEEIKGRERERRKELVSMRIYVHVREKVIALECGDGTQDVIWLGNAAMVHYDSSFGRKYGSPKCIQKEGGITCDPDARVCDLLDDNQHVFAVLDTDDDDENEATP